MQRKPKIVAALLGGVCAMPALHACVTVPETQEEYEVCSDAAGDCPDETAPVEVE